MKMENKNGGKPRKKRMKMKYKISDNEKKNLETFLSLIN